MANDRPTDLPRAVLPNDDVRAEIEAAARATVDRPDFPADYAERVAEQSARFALRTGAHGDLRAALSLLEEQT